MKSLHRYIIQMKAQLEVPQMGLNSL